MAIEHNNRVYDSQLLTMKILYVNDIDITQKVLHRCLNISMHNPTKHNAQFSHEA